MARYALSISFLSNEHPFSTLYEPYPADRFKSDLEAAHWAQDMSDGLGALYLVTLLKDGTVLEVTCPHCDTALHRGVAFRDLPERPV